MTIEILNKRREIETTIETHRPEWSFEQYCRNRVTAGWTWRLQSHDLTSSFT